MRIQLAWAIVAGLTLAAAACRSIPPKTAAYGHCASAISPTEHCSADGIVSVQAIDEQRILIAIDTQGGQKPDGLVDQLFLYTASEPHRFQARDESFTGHVEYGQGVLRVVAKDGRQPLLFLVLPVGAESATSLDKGTERLFEHSIGLSRYSGLHGLRVARLKALHPSDHCDGPPGACLEVDGFRIRFPS